jgi:hypothetical protein
MSSHIRPLRVFCSAAVEHAGTVKSRNPDVLAILNALDVLLDNFSVSIPLLG